MAVHRHPTGPGLGHKPRGGGVLLPGNPADDFRADVLAGLAKPQKTIPAKYFYDAAGSALFDLICETPEYYPTRAELAVMAAHAAEMGECLGPDCLVVEYGSGSSLKTRWLLRHLPRPAGYVPVDISADHLRAAAAALAAEFPGLAVRPVAADFTRPFAVPAVAAARRVVYFPGSTVGNFDPPDAAGLLRGVAKLCGPGGRLLLGVDRKKDPAVLYAAYNDAAGVTARFNLNLLTRLNRELGADFDVAQFRHRACYHAALGRVEMHLESATDQLVRVAGAEFRFAAGETIHTENSYKYAPAEVTALAAAAGLVPVRDWTEPDGLFGVHLFAVA